MTTRALAYTIAFTLAWAFLLGALVRFMVALIIGEIS